MCQPLANAHLLCLYRSEFTKIFGSRKNLFEIFLLLLLLRLEKGYFLAA